MHEFLQELKKDHQEVKGILDKLKDSSGGKNRETLFKKLMTELHPHMKAEEKVFYPVLAEEEDAREDTLESIEEHHVSEMVLKELEKMEKSEEQWLAKMKVFAELVDHHIKEEEKKIFKGANKVLGKDQMTEILEQFQTAKEQLRSQLK